MASAYWSERVDGILGGDAIAVLGLVTPAAGVVLIPVAPVGMRDRVEGTVTFTSSLGYWRKLERIDRNNRVALLYSDRSHGHSEDPLTVLVQGDASIESCPNETFLDELFQVDMPRFFGLTPQGVVWDRLTHVYNRVRVRVTVSVKRLLAWDPASGDVVETRGDPPPPKPRPQRVTAGGTGPRVSIRGTARRAARLRTTCLGYVGHDTYPVLTQVNIMDHSTDGLDLSSVRRLPQGGRRASLFSQTFGPQLTGVSVQHLSGWLHVSQDGLRFSPHRARGFTAPFGMRFATFVGSIQTRVGLRKARQKGLVIGEGWAGTKHTQQSDTQPRTVNTG